MDLDSCVDAGVPVALVNGLTGGLAGGRPADDVEPLAAIRAAIAINPASVARLAGGNVPGFVALATELRVVFDRLDRGDVDAAAYRLNGLLARHPANPHLAKEGQAWRLHQYPADAALLAMWTAICVALIATALAAAFELSAPTDDPVLAAAACRQHEAIARAVARRDAQKAADAMMRVIRQGWITYTHGFDRRLAELRLRDFPKTRRRRPR